jgi:hypothetical protein
MNVYLVQTVEGVPYEYGYEGIVVAENINAAIKFGESKTGLKNPAGNVDARLIKGLSISNSTETFELTLSSDDIITIPQPKTRVDWTKVNELLKSKIKDNNFWNEVKKTNICFSWFNFMLSKNK